MEDGKTTRDEWSERKRWRYTTHASPLDKEDAITGLVTAYRLGRARGHAQGLALGRRAGFTALRDLLVQLASHARREHEIAGAAKRFAASKALRRTADALDIASGYVNQLFALAKSNPVEMPDTSGYAATAADPRVEG